MIATLFSSLALAGGLDGKTFDVALVDPQKKSDADQLVFASGQFESPGCAKYGFGKAAYVATESGSSWTVTVDQVSPTEGKNHWALTVTGSHVVGTLDWTKAGQAPIRYAVAGDLHK
jgi:hypothetical protein